MQPKAVGFALAVVTLMAGCDAAPNAAKVLDPSGLRIGTENIISNPNERDVPWGMTDTHPCTGDVITFTGNSHMVVHIGFDSMGNLHFSSNVVTKGQGLGTSGKIYKIMDQEKFSDQAPVNAENAIIKDMQEAKVNGPTTGDDYTTVFMDKVTVASDGTFAVDVKRDSYRCK
jgi:hypothetical protein